MRDYQQSYLESTVSELDPTHQRNLDIGFKGMRYSEELKGMEYVEVEAAGWKRLCRPDVHYGMPCDCQEMSCEQ